MTNTKLREMRSALEHKRAELEKEVRLREVLTIEPSSDEMDRIQHVSEREYAIDKLERSSKRLGEIRAALRRIDAGTFGICAECDEDINLKRLAALPWAPFCIPCQEAADHQQETPGNETDTSLLMTA